MFRSFVARALRKAARTIDPSPPLVISQPAWKGGPYYCPVCDQGVKYFDNLSEFFLKPLIDHKNIHSPWMAENPNLLHYSCPACGASDRDRLYSLYFHEVWGKRTEQSPIRFLDVAPSTPLSRCIRRYSFIDYRSADLMMEQVDDHVDLTDMSIYDDASWDCFLCSHVLEHIPADVKAMSELYRVLRPGGWGIAMVPISLSLIADYENPDAKTPEERWKYFGQDDHVRMYSKPGFIRKLTSCGFQVEQLGQSHFTENVMHRSGIHPRCVLYVVHKPSL